MGVAFDKTNAPTTPTDPGRHDAADGHRHAGRCRGGHARRERARRGRVLHDQHGSGETATDVHQGLHPGDRGRPADAMRRSSTRRRSSSPRPTRASTRSPSTRRATVRHGPGHVLAPAAPAAAAARRAHADRYGRTAAGVPQAGTSPRPRRRSRATRSPSTTRAGAGRCRRLQPAETVDAQQTVTGLTAGTAYGFTVKAKNATGFGGESTKVTLTPTG